MSAHQCTSDIFKEIKDSEMLQDRVNDDNTYKGDLAKRNDLIN